MVPLIGRGGFDEVRRVYDRKLERVVAMKLLQHHARDAHPEPLERPDVAHGHELVRGIIIKGGGEIVRACVSGCVTRSRGAPADRARPRALPWPRAG